MAITELATLSHEDALAELEITRRERDEAEEMAASHLDDKHRLEAERRTIRLKVHADHKFELDDYKRVIDEQATELFSYKPVDTKEAVNSLELTQVGALMAEPEEDIEWLLDECVFPGSVNAMAEPPKIGKSCSLRQMAVAVSTGGTWLGKVCTQATVLWIGVEDARRTTRKHFQSMLTDPKAPLHVWAGPPPSPDTIPTHEWLGRLIRRHDAKLVIIENFGKLTTIEDFSDYSIVTTALKPYDRLAVDTGAAILVGLHVRKSGGEDGTAVLGSTQWVGGPSTIFEMCKENDNRFISSIQREGEGMEKTMLRWDAETRTYQIGATKREADSKALQEAIMGYLASNGGASSGEVSDAVGKKRQRVTGILNKLVEDGWLERAGKGRAGDPFRYSLAD